MSDPEEESQPHSRNAQLSRCRRHSTAPRGVLGSPERSWSESCGNHFRPRLWITETRGWHNSAGNKRSDL